MRYREILEACWKGYHREGNKKMFGKTYPNCVKNKKKSNEDIDQQGVAEGFPQPGESSGKAKQFNPNAKVQTREMTLDQILNSVKGIPYVNNVVDDWDAKDYSWGVTKKVIEYAQYLQKNPQSVANLPPLVVIDGQLNDGAHRLSAINLLQKRMDPKNPLWKQVKLKVNFGTSADVASEQGVAEGELDEACWDGYAQQGVKKKGDRMVPNCVSMSEHELEEDLKKWFKQKWVRFGPDGKIRGDCARGDDSEGKPKCLPQSKAHSLGKKGRASAAAKKRREDPNPERRGAAKNVATRVRENEVKDLEKVLQNPHSYDAIDHMMQSIAKKSKITAKQLHDRFVAKHNKTPDDWIKNKGA